MRLAASAALVLTLLVPCPAAAGELPATDDVQRAYDEAKPEGRDKHVDGLKIVGVKCALAANGRYSCEVGFTVPNGDEDRVYLDAASLERSGERWRLVGGLCRGVN